MYAWTTDERQSQADAAHRIRHYADRNHLNAVALARQTGLPARAARAILSGFGSAVSRRHLDEATINLPR